MRRILFVDDEPMVLEGLQRMLRPLRNEWEMDFVESGTAALEKLEQTPYDAVVSDMRMPGMDGSELLNEVMKRRPETVRIILSGHSDEAMILRCVGTAHQFLSKPCEANVLKATVTRACAQRGLMGNPDLKRLVTQIDTIPSLPSLSVDLFQELRCPDPSIQKIAHIISKDVGMSAKVLQLANSAFFGSYCHISSPERAVVVLGLRTIEALVLSNKIFAQFSQESLQGVNIEALSAHGLRVGVLARAISKHEGLPQEATNDAFTAGLLHDVGKMLLAANLPKDYAMAMSLSAKQGLPQEATNDAFTARLLLNGGKMPLAANLPKDYAMAMSLSAKQGLPSPAAEREVFGGGHSELGAYLLGLWGLPDSVVEAIAFHHQPSACPHQEFGALSAVHIADALDYADAVRYESSSVMSIGLSSRLDMQHLNAVGKAGHIEEWREIHRDTVGDNKAA